MSNPTQCKEKTFTISEKEEHRLAHSDLILTTKYPDENPENALDDITNALEHLGFFDHLK